jgi:F-type H+-transporting ATPase subunit delta
MAETTTIARPYGVAAYTQARKEGNVPLWDEMLEFCAAVASEPAMAALLANPRIERSALGDLFLAVAGGRLSSTGAGFVRVLQENRRFEVLPQIYQIFQELRAADESRADVDIVAAYAVNAKYKHELEAAMQRRLGCEVTVTTTIDRGLIGGMIVRAGDMTIDLSLRGALNRLSHELRR